jgi:hypothetical protein
VDATTEWKQYGRSVSGVIVDQSNQTSRSDGLTLNLKIQTTGFFANRAKHIAAKSHCCWERMHTNKQPSDPRDQTQQSELKLRM